MIIQSTIRSSVSQGEWGITNNDGLLVEAARCWRERAAMNGVPIGQEGLDDEKGQVVDECFVGITLW